MTNIKANDVITTPGRQQVKVAEVLDAKDGFEIRVLGHLWVKSRNDWTRKTSLWEFRKDELIDSE